MGRRRHGRRDWTPFCRSQLTHMTRRPAPTARPLQSPLAMWRLSAWPAVFPGAADLQTYWRTSARRVDAIGEPPADWDAELYLDPVSSANDRVYSPVGEAAGRTGPVSTRSVTASCRVRLTGESRTSFSPWRSRPRLSRTPAYLDRGSRSGGHRCIVGRGTYINRGFTNGRPARLVVDQRCGSSGTAPRARRRGAGGPQDGS